MFIGQNILLRFLIRKSRRVIVRESCQSVELCSYSYVIKNKFSISFSSLNISQSLQSNVQIRFFPIQLIPFVGIYFSIMTMSPVDDGLPGGPWFTSVVNKAIG